MNREILFRAKHIHTIPGNDREYLRQPRIDRRDKRWRTIYVNGQRVDKKDLEKMEIHIESVKKILSEKLTKNK